MKGKLFLLLIFVIAIFASGVYADSSWDISNLAYDGVKLDPHAEGKDIYGKSIFFKPNGRKLWVLNDYPDKVYQFSLSTAWDLNTATFDSKWLNIKYPDDNFLEDYPQSIFFKPDGTKLFVTGLGNWNSMVYQFSLSTAWEIDTANYDYVSYELTYNGQFIPYGLFFNPDGTKMFVVDNDNIHSYTLSTAWNLNTVTYDEKYLSCRDDGEIGCHEVFFHPDGKKMWAIGGMNRDTVKQYSLGTAWDIDTMTHDKDSPEIQSEYPESLFFHPDGETLFYAGNQGSNTFIYQYSNHLEESIDEGNCANGDDDDSDGEKDWDTQVWSSGSPTGSTDNTKGDSDCPIEILSAEVSDTNPDANTNIDVYCEASVENVTSVMAYVDKNNNNQYDSGEDCGWNAGSDWGIEGQTSNTAVFKNCNVGNTGTKDVFCSVYNGGIKPYDRSYQTGTDKSKEIDVQSTTCSDYNDDETACDARSNCKYVNNCQQSGNKYYTGENACVENTQTVNYECSTECGNDCDGATPPPDKNCDSNDGCYGGNYRDYLSVTKACKDDCTWNNPVCNNYEEETPPLNDNQKGVCSGSTKTCNGNGWENDYSSISDYESTETTCDGLDNDCDGETDEDCTSCGDGTVQSPNDNGVYEECDPADDDFAAAHCIKSGSDRCTCEEEYPPDGDGNCVGAYIDIGIRYHYDGVNYKIAAEPSDSITSPYKIKRDKDIYGIALVDPSNEHASHIRTKIDGEIDGEIKAFRLYEDDDCFPETCASSSYECGTHDDGCGGSLSCGTCSKTNTECDSGSCVCSLGYSDCNGDGSCKCDTDAGYSCEGTVCKAPCDPFFYDQVEHSSDYLETYNPECLHDKDISGWTYGEDDVEKEWGCYTEFLDVKDDWDGKQNTGDIVNGCSESNIAAKFCDNLVIDGKSNWYLPANYQVEYFLFKHKGQNKIEGIVNDYYWSSTESDGGTAYGRHSSGSSPSAAAKDSSTYIRCVRDVDSSGNCLPDTCASLGYECGTHDDGCEGTIDCSGCPSGEYCEDGICLEAGPTTSLCGDGLNMNTDDCICTETESGKFHSDTCTANSESGSCSAKTDCSNFVSGNCLTERHNFCCVCDENRDETISVCTNSLGNIDFDKCDCIDVDYGDTCKALSSRGDCTAESSCKSSTTPCPDYESDVCCTCDEGDVETYALCGKNEVSGCTCYESGSSSNYQDGCEIATATGSCSIEDSCVSSGSSGCSIWSSNYCCICNEYTSDTTAECGDNEISGCNCIRAPKDRDCKAVSSTGSCTERSADFDTDYCCVCPV